MTKPQQYSEEWWAECAPPTATRCKATARSGRRCGNAIQFGHLICRFHGGATKQVRRKAHERVMLAADEAVATVLGLMQDASIPAAVRLAAAKDLLDRAEVVGKQRVSVEVDETPWGKIVGEILVKVPEPLEDVVDAEIVDDGADAQRALDEAAYDAIPNAPVLPIVTGDRR